MKKKSINGVTRRRGTTIAAAALSVALVTPFVHPVVNPGASPVAAAQDAASAQDRSVDSKGTSEATAIRADGTWGQKKGYQGTVYLDRDKTPDDQDDADEAMPGVKVFLQYVNGKGQVSPIYYTTSDSEGKFVFDLSKAPKDGLGNPLEFKLAGDPEFQVRTWAENPDPAKYTLAGGGDMYSGRFHNRVTRKWETWDFTAGINRIVDSRVVFQERPNVDGWLAKPEAQWTEAPTADKKWPQGGNYGTARGNVWWENNDAAGSLANQYSKGPSDRAATDVKVVGSYVNDEVARKFDAWKAANKNYSREQFRVAQKDIVDKYQAEHGAGSHIAESRVAYVKDDGSFYLPFAGLYGVDRNKKGNKTTDEEWGTLVSAKDEKHDNLMQWDGTLGQRHRHINKDYMYLYPVVGDNRDLWMGNYQDNMFQPADGGGLGVSLESDNISEQNFALLTPRPMHDVFNYDNTSSIAAPGDTAKSKTTGLVPNQKYAIEWFADGKSTGKVCTATANELGELDSCDFTVPKDLTKATVYSSQVFAADASGKPTGTLLLADSFLADPTVVKDNESFAPGYEDGSGKPGEDAKVDAPKFTDKDGNSTTAPEGTKFAPGDGAPEGVTVNEDGSISVKVLEGAKPGDEITVPVVVTYPDGSTDTVDVTVTVEDPDKFQPEYGDGSGKPGEDVTVPAPTIKDQDGNDTEVPEDTKFTPGEGAPDGVTVDENTGEVTVPVSEDAKPGDEITVPVDVTHPDGSTDTVDVTVTVDDPDTNEPDWKDSKTTPGESVEIDKDSNSGDVKPGTTVEVTDGPGTAEIDDNGKITVKPNEDAKPGDKIVVEVKDPVGHVIDTVEIAIEEKDESGSSITDGSSILDGSSNVDWERCAPAAAGLGLPLLFLLPIGLASQMNIPGFSPLVKQVSAQIDGINRQLGAQTAQFQKQLGIYNGPLARQANQINVMLKKSGVDRVAGGVALAAAGALALGLVASACSPNGGSSSSSSSSK